MVSNVRAGGEPIRRFILENIESHDGDIANFAAAKFGITRQAVNKHLLRLREQGAVVKDGSARAPKYKLAPLNRVDFIYEISTGLEEDVVWRNDVRPVIEPLPANVLNIWHHGFTEMFNNAIEHSAGKQIYLRITKTAVTTEVLVSDDGVGIFKKIQMSCGLLDERHALFELAKGKLTTDPKNHSGEGIFFTSRMFDKFAILSGGLLFDHQKAAQYDWLVERKESEEGTTVFMELNNHTALTTRKVFDEYTTGDDDHTFSKTVVPVNLAKYGQDELVSRSQAKRLLARVDLFRAVILDFNEVEEIGQAFADQIFRVFANEHPEINLTPINMSEGVRAMVERARANKDAG